MQSLETGHSRAQGRATPEVAEAPPLGATQLVPTPSGYI